MGEVRFFSKKNTRVPPYVFFRVFPKIEKNHKGVPLCIKKFSGLRPEWGGGVIPRLHSQKKFLENDPGTGSKVHWLGLMDHFFDP